MLQEDRHRRIRALLAYDGQASTQRIANELGVSRETVRRDVLRLEASGDLRRVHGGILAGVAEAEPPLQLRTKTNALEKRAIVRAAARLVLPGQSLFIDAGSTVSMLAEELASLRDLTVVTNSFDVALRLASPTLEGGLLRHQVHVLGGRPNPGLAATYGDQTVAEVMRWRLDWAMLSPVGVDASMGASSFDPAEAELARAMVGQARHTCLLADYSKIGVGARVSFCGIKQIGHLITNKRAAGSATLHALAETGCQVTLV